MKRLLILLVCVLSLCMLPACAEEYGSAPLNDASNYYAIGIGEDVCVLAWEPVPETIPTEECFLSIIVGTPENYLKTFAVESGVDAVVFNRAELLDTLSMYLYQDQAELESQGYSFEADRYVFFGPTPIFKVEDAGDLGWMQVQLHQATKPLPSNSGFVLGDHKPTVGPDGNTLVNGMLKNTGDEMACIESVEAMVLMDSRLNVVVCPVKDVQTPFVGIQPDIETPVTMTVEVPDGFAPFRMLPICTLAEDGFVERVDVKGLESETTIGRSGEYCLRYSLPYEEGTDVADYYLVVNFYSIEFGYLETMWHAPGEGWLEDGRVVFPLLPMQLEGDSLMNLCSGYRVGHPAADAAGEAAE